MDSFRTRLILAYLKQHRVCSFADLMEKFDIGAWVDKPIAKIQDKKPQAKRKPKPAAKVVIKATAKAEPTLAERLRAALLERLAA